MANENYRKFVLWGALAVTVLAALWVDDDTEQYADDTVVAVQPATNTSNSRRAAAGQARAALPIDQLGKRKFSAEADDIFAVTSWEPKRTAATTAAGMLSSQPTLIPRQVAAQPPPAVVAPPLQFEYLGRVSAEGKTRVFLALADGNHVAGVGERIDGRYRVDRIREDAVELTYLPLGVKQTLLINEKNPGRMR